VDYWSLAWPRFVQGIGVGFIFVPLNTVALANVAREKMGNATVLLNVVRNLGGGIGVALMAMFLARRGQEHQSAMVAHIQTGDPETGELHIYGHDVDEQDVEDVLADPLEDRPGRDGSWLALGQTRAGRYLRVVYVPDEARRSAFVITAYPVGFNVVRALRRRRRRKQ